MQTVLEILTKTEAFFAQKGVPNPKLDAQLLLAHALECKRLELFLRFEEPLTEVALSKIRELVRRRGRREPLQHIIGSQEFFGAKLKCDARALIPRPETEELCEILSERFFTDKSAALKILDMGTGSGAIAVALALHFPNAQVDAVDASDEAISLAKENAENNSAIVNIYKSDWFSEVEGEYDLIVSNPPYLTDAELAESQPEVKNFDPIAALVSAENGMADIYKILSGAKNHLKAKGILAFECSLGQPEKLAEKAANFGFANAQTFKDASRRTRFAIFSG